MKRKGTLLLFVLVGSIISACCSSKKYENQSKSDVVSIPGPKIIIYKTRNDYSKLVPITLSDDRKSVVSYPDVKDVFFNGELAYPTQLHQGFLLDNRGISSNSAFLTFTYEEYSKLSRTPDAKELMRFIQDSDPFISMYSYSKRPSRESLEQELNGQIDSGNFAAFTKIK